VFDDVVKRVHSTQKDYTIFGHSAGGQFVERFVEFMPQARVRQAVAANPGWHTMPDAAQTYPYGLKKLPTGDADLKVAFQRDFTLLLGEDDTDPYAEDLQRDPKTDLQGINRLERGLNFYAAAQKYAGAGNPFNWKLRVIAGVGHSHGGAAKAAAPLLFP
jgi:pimeloyl-ACP methyl ester carboxylesterase